MSKTICIIPLMEPDEYLEASIASVINDVDYLLFSVNERSWGNPDITLTPENRQWIQEYAKTNPKFRLMIGHWNSEPEQHNAGITYATSLGCDVVVCNACDQVYGEGSVKKMIQVLRNTDAEVVRAQWYTFWKKDPLCVIWPPEGYCPILAFKIGKFQYYDVSEGKLANADGTMREPKTHVFGLHEAPLFHFSFARDDEFIKKKMDMSSHRHQVVPDWYENVWLKWTPKMENIHPCWPGVFKKAVEFPLEKLPESVRGIFKKE